MMLHVRFLSHFVENRSIEHFKSDKQVLRYIKGTLYCGKKYIKGHKRSDCGGDTEGIRSTPGVVIFSAGIIMTWVSQSKG